MEESKSWESYTGEQNPLPGFLDSASSKGSNVASPTEVSDIGDRTCGTVVGEVGKVEQVDIERAHNFLKTRCIAKRHELREKMENWPEAPLYRSVLERLAQSRIMDNSEFEEISIKQMDKIGYIGDSSDIMPFLTAGEFLVDGSFIGFYRNSDKYFTPSPLTTGEKLLKDDRKCHLVRTDRDGNITVIEINLNAYENTKSPNATVMRWNNTLAAILNRNLPNQYAKRMAEFEMNPTEKRGELGRIFNEIEDEFEKKFEIKQDKYPLTS